MAGAISFDKMKPTAGDAANSYELYLDIAPLGDTDDAPAAEAWVNVPDIKNLNPTSTATTDNTATYAHRGAKAESKTGEDWSGSVDLLKLRDKTGEFQPEFGILNTAAHAKGRANRLWARWYDAKGATYAFQGIVSVTDNGRQGTDVTGVDFHQFGIASYGEVLPIANPVKATGKGGQA